MKKSLSLIALVLSLCCISLSCSSADFSRRYDPRIPVITLQEVFLKPGDSVVRFFGDLEIILKISPTGDSVDCSLYLSTQLVGVQTLIQEQNTYVFDVQLANYTAKGQLTLVLNKAPDTFSKVNGNFVYSVVSNNQSFIFKGDLIAWHMTG